MEFPILSINNPKVNTFILQISPIVVNEYIKRKQKGEKTILPSVCIAQAALESGWNIGSKTLFGIKGSDIHLDTTEYINGEYVNISDSFKLFPDVTGAVQGYYDLMQWDNYDDATTKESYQEQLEGLTNDVGYKYATDPHYYTKCVSIIESYNLYEFDNFVNAHIYNNTDSTQNQDTKEIYFETDEGNNIIGNYIFVVTEYSVIYDYNNTCCTIWYDEYNCIEFNSSNCTIVLSKDGSVFGRFAYDEIMKHGYIEKR